MDIIYDFHSQFQKLFDHFSIFVSLMEYFFYIQHFNISPLVVYYSTMQHSLC